MSDLDYILFIGYPKIEVFFILSHLCFHYASSFFFCIYDTIYDQTRGGRGDFIMPLESSYSYFICLLLLSGVALGWMLVCLIVRTLWDTEAHNAP